VTRAGRSLQPGLSGGTDTSRFYSVTTCNFFSRLGVGCHGLARIGGSRSPSVANNAHSQPTFCARGPSITSLLSLDRTIENVESAEQACRGKEGRCLMRIRGRDWTLLSPLLFRRGARSLTKTAVQFFYGSHDGHPVTWNNDWMALIKKE
jgi:hypothetical protein